MLSLPPTDGSGWCLLSKRLENGSFQLPPITGETARSRSTARRSRRCSPASTSRPRVVGVPIQAYLTWAFERLGTHRDAFALPVEQLTPAPFKRSRC